MKNLKKILSLTLALAMALSLMTTALAKDTGDFADGDDVSYAEAVDVMATVGVFNGTGDGSNFDPKGTLTREQAAKIITYMVMGQTQADKLVATIAPFADVSADRWSAGAIAYCASEGIMNGTGNGKFNPTGELTGLQFAKMLLVALGYDAEIEKMTGPAWGLATSKLAYAVELDDGLGDINLTAVMTREQAAQMAFTTMKTPMVQYPDKGSSISVNGAVVEFGAQKAEYVTADITTGKANSSNIDNKVLSDGKALIEFGERYCPDLVKKNTTNSLEQPIRKWTYKNNTIGRYNVAEEQVVVVGARDKNLNDILTGKSYMNYSNSDLSLRYNSGTEEHPAMSNYVYLNGVEQSSALNSIALNKGDVVYAYENSDGKVYKVVIARYSLAKVDSVADNMSSTEKEKGSAYRVKLVNLAGTTVIGNSAYYDDSSKDEEILNGFDSKTYTKDTVLAVALKNDASKGIADSYVAEVLTGKPTAVKEATGTNNGTGEGDITIDGTRYAFVTNSAKDVLIDGVYSDFDFDNEYAVYLTKEDYVLGIEGVTSANVDDLYYVTGVYIKDSSYGETNKEYYAQRVSLADGKMDTVRVEKGSLQIITKNANMTGKVPNASIAHADSQKWAGVYTFNDKRVAGIADMSAGGFGGTGKAEEQKADNEVLTMVPFAADTAVNRDFSATNGGALKAGDTKVAGGVKTDATKIAVSGTDGQTFYVNENTKYVAVSRLGSDIDVTYAQGGMKVTSDPVDTIVVYDKDDQKTAIAVIYVDQDDDLQVSTTKQDVIYLAAPATRKVSATTWEATIYDMKDNTSRNVILDDDYEQGFFVYSEKADGSLKLEDATPLTLSNAYDDEEGFTNKITTFKIISVYKDVRFDTNQPNYKDINFNKTLVIDNRSESTRNAEGYKTPITSVADLKTATDDGCQIEADIYFNKGATFIAVDHATKNQTDAVTFALTDPAGGSNDCDTSDTTVTVTVEGGNDTATLTVTKTGSQTLEVGGTNASMVTVTDGNKLVISGMEDSNSYTFTVTVSEPKKSDRVYTVNVTTLKAAKEVDAAGLAAAMTAAKAGDVINVTDAITLSADLTVKEGVTVNATQGISSNAKALNVNGTLKVPSGNVTGTVASIGKNGTLDVTGTVGTVTDLQGRLKATGTITEITGISDAATVNGNVTTLGDVDATGKTAKVTGNVGTLGKVTAGTLEVTGNVTTLSDMKGGTLEVKGDNNKIGTIDDIEAANKGDAITIKGNVDTITKITKGTVSITGTVGNVTDVLADGVLTIDGAVGTAIVDNNGELTVTGNVAELSDNNGTLTIKGDLATFTKITDGTLTLEGNATIVGGTTTLTGGTIVVKSTDTKALTINVAAATTLANITLNGVNGAKIVVRGITDSNTLTVDADNNMSANGSDKLNTALNTDDANGNYVFADGLFKQQTA